MLACTLSGLLTGIYDDLFHTTENTEQIIKLTVPSHQACAAENTMEAILAPAATRELGTKWILHKSRLRQWPNADCSLLYCTVNSKTWCSKQLVDDAAASIFILLPHPEPWSSLHDTTVRLAHSSIHT